MYKILDKITDTEITTYKLIDETNKKVIRTESEVIQLCIDKQIINPIDINKDNDIIYYMHKYNNESINYLSEKMGLRRETIKDEIRKFKLKEARFYYAQSKNDNNKMDRVLEHLIRHGYTKSEIIGATGLNGTIIIKLAVGIHTKKGLELNEIARILNVDIAEIKEEKTQDTIIKYYSLLGMSINAISKQLNVDKDRVELVLNESKTKLSIQYNGSSKDLYEIANRLDIDIHIIEDAYIDFKNKYSIPYETLYFLRKRGKKRFSDIAKMYRKSVNAVREMCILYGID